MSDSTLDKFGAAGVKLLDTAGPPLALWLLEKLYEKVRGYFDTMPREEAEEAAMRLMKPEMTEEERKAQLAALILAATSG